MTAFWCFAFGCGVAALGCSVLMFFAWAKEVMRDDQ